MKVIARTSGEIRIELDETTPFKGLVVIIGGERLSNGFAGHVNSIRFLDSSNKLSIENKEQIASAINEWAKQQKSIHIEKSNETILDYEIIIH